MSLSTLSSDGYPSTRIVLLKQFDDKGFVYFIQTIIQIRESQ